MRLKIKRLLAQADVNRQLAEIQSRQQGEQNMGLVGDSPAMERLRGEIRQVARSQAAVLINGESGTGKELVARAIHNQSDRADRAFLAVNCAGIPPDLMESEFFGHEAGAFTGARQARKGLFAEASGGTLLLDEIGEMPLSLQAKLLRVLQEGAIKPVGADHEETVDVRILAATHVNLMKAVEGGLFRKICTTAWKPPRCRGAATAGPGEDVEMLAMHFLKEACRRHNRGFIKFSDVTLRVLRDYLFPGNVRELSSAIERAVTFCDGDTIQPEHLPERIRKRQSSLQAPPADPVADSIPEWPTLEALQQDYVRKVMAAVDGNKRRCTDPRY